MVTLFWHTPPCDLSSSVFCECIYNRIIGCSNKIIKAPENILTGLVCNDCCHPSVRIIPVHITGFGFATWLLAVFAIFLSGSLGGRLPSTSLYGSEVDSILETLSPQRAVLLQSDRTSAAAANTGKSVERSLADSSVAPAVLPSSSQTEYRCMRCKSEIVLLSATAFNNMIQSLYISFLSSKAFRTVVAVVFFKFAFVASSASMKCSVPLLFEAFDNHKTSTKRGMGDWNQAGRAMHLHSNQESNGSARQSRAAPSQQGQTMYAAKLSFPCAVLELGARD